MPFVSLIRWCEHGSCFDYTLNYFFRSYLSAACVKLKLRYKGCRKSTGFDNAPRYAKFDQNLAPLLEVV